jgi:hypothetical protein
MKQNLFETKLNKFIVEELGISNDVTNETIKLSKEFTKIIDSNKQKQSINNDVKYSENTFVSNIFNEKVHVALVCYYFRDNETYQMYKNRGKIDDSGKSSVRILPNSRKIIRLTVECVKVNGTLQRGFYDTLQHELTHIYQQLKANKNYPITDNYLMASSILSGNGTNNFEKNVALVFYFLGCGELTAYDNGLYQFLANSEDNYKTDDEIMKDVYNSSLYKFYQVADFCIANIDNKGFENPLSKFKITKKRFIAMCKYLQWRVMKSIGRVIIKFKNDYMLEGVTYNPFSGLNNFYKINDERNFF